MGGSSSKIIVFVGPHGSGKSQFIDCLTQKTQWANDRLTSNYNAIRSVKVKMRNKDHVVLVDTPGFDDEGSANNVLTELLDWLRQNYKADTKVAGVIYLHNIQVNRFTQPPPQILRQLCGKDAARHLRFVTTHWDQISHSIRKFAQREQEIRTRLQSFLSAGARMERFDMNEDEAWRIVESLV